MTATLSSDLPAYTVRYSARARRVNLHISVQRGLELVLPKGFDQQEIPQVLQQHRAWIEKHLAPLQQRIAKEDPSVLPTHLNLRAFDEHWTINYIRTMGRLRCMVRPQYELVLYGKIDQPAVYRQRLLQWLKHYAKQRFAAQLLQLAEQTQLSYSQLSIRGQKTRWGSCSSSQAISLNFKLLFLPPTLMQHVMLHELCHTVHAHHGKRFWQLLAKHDPKWQAHNKALRQGNDYVPLWVGE